MLCLHCNVNEAATRTRGQRQGSYCSLRCQQQAYRRRRSSGKAPTNCRECKAPLAPRTPGKTGRHAIYCSAPCEGVASRRREKERRDEGRVPIGRVSSVQPGMRFGKLTVLDCAPKFARVECDCGTIKHAVKYNLLAGDAISCGCVRREILMEARAQRQLRGELFLANNRVGYVQSGRPATRDGSYGVYAVEPSAEFDDSPVCYVVSTRGKETEHCNFDEARVEYLIRSGRMSA